MLEPVRIHKPGLTLKTYLRGTVEHLSIGGLATLSGGSSELCMLTSWLAVVIWESGPTSCASQMHDLSNR